MGWVIFIIVVAAILLIPEKKAKAPQRGAAPPASVPKHTSIDRLIDILLDLPKLDSPCICTLSVDEASGYSTAINVSIRILDARTSCATALSEFERFKRSAIDEAVKNGMGLSSEQADQIKSLEASVNKTLVSVLFKEGAQPASYVFLHLREFLKPSGDDMTVDYPVPMEPGLKDYRGKILGMISPKFAAQYPDAKVSLSDDSLSICF